MKALRALHATDYYKVGHHPMYPDKTEFVASNFTCRSDRWAQMLPDYDHKVVNPGMQGVAQWLLQGLWNDTFFDEPEEKVLAEYAERVGKGLGIPNVDVAHIKALHQLGYLPIRIKELKPGSRVNLRVPLWTIINTLPNFGWLTNYLETQLSAEYWQMVTTATIAYEYRRLFLRFAKLTGVHPDFTQWQGHDFSMRGMAGIHAATQSGAAHLMSFRGTDTVSAIDYLEEYYAGRATFVGGSVPATEHSVMCMGMADEEGELGTFRRLLTKVHPEGIVSIVSDTDDFWQVVTEFMVALKDIIMARTMANGEGAGKLVIRPDSGDPVRILCGEAWHWKGNEMPTWQDLDALLERGYKVVKIGDQYFRFEAQLGVDAEGRPDRVAQMSHVPYPTPAMKGAVQCLYEVFGGTRTETGHIMLDPHIGLIYGDSISLERANTILSTLAHMGFCSGFVVFGIGSYTYQHVTRDTFGTAIKATYGVVDGKGRELFKAPKTDSGVKFSARGLLRAEEVNGEFVLHERQTPEQEQQGAYATIFEDGRIVNPHTLADIRERLHAGQF